MADSDMIKLYSGRILELTTSIPHTQRLEAPDATVRKRSPLCGSSIIVDLTVENGRVARFGQDVKACALGQASAAVVGQAIIGRTRAEIETARDQLRDMLKSDGSAPDAPFDGLEVLSPAKDYKNRHASILLAIEAAAEAFAQAEESACA